MVLKLGKILLTKGFIVSCAEYVASPHQVYYVWQAHPRVMGLHLAQRHVAPVFQQECIFAIIFDGFGTSQNCPSHLIKNLNTILIGDDRKGRHLRELILV